MSKFLTSASLATLLAVSAASAQTADPPRTQPQSPPAATTPSPSTSAPAPSSPSATDSTSANRPAGPVAGTMGSSLKLTEAEAKNWVGKTVYSSDEKNLGEVAAFQRGSDGKVHEMHADIGGFLGIGETRVRVLPSEFSLSSDRVILKMSGEQAKALPKLDK